MPCRVIRVDFGITTYMHAPRTALIRGKQHVLLLARSSWHGGVAKHCLKVLDEKWIFNLIAYSNNTDLRVGWCFTFSNLVDSEFILSSVSSSVRSVQYRWTSVQTSTRLAVGITPTTTAGFSKALPAALRTEFTGRPTRQHAHRSLTPRACMRSSLCTSRDQRYVSRAS